MSEIELKFQIPTSQRNALTAAILQMQPTSVALVAHYYDTPTLSLAEQHISLRQRLEDRVWKQTLKAPSPQAAKRLEIDITLAQVPKKLDLNCYRQHPQAKALLKPVLKKKSMLARQLSTDVKRHVLEQQHHNSCIEIALDQGWLITPHKRTKISEIEFELKSGQVPDLIAIIRPWVEQYALYLDTQSKAERGYALLQNQAEAATYQSAYVLKPSQSSEQALRSMVNQCLQHALPNASAIARDNYHAEHVHQLRVAIRRLRTAFKSFRDWTNADLTLWQQQLKTLFQQLGATRDQDALTESLIPQLQQAGSPILKLPQNAGKSVNLSRLLQAPSTTLLWLELIAFSQSPVHQKVDPLPKLARQRIVKLQDQIMHQAAQFMDLSIEEKHHLRKRVKQLRYSLEFSRGLFKDKTLKAYLTALKPVQQVLGEFNDLSVAETLVCTVIEKEPRYWFILGWLRAQQQQVLARAALVLQQFSTQAKF
ncbi:CYTH and CHAD domain-containing protein [Acinetobacter sp. B51(2017)]|uniref:CYTH and CHAD domain-containing protein n=1 Tax=Acinetobacter sp. B51(2017) TaxID=2060938 RepID=UPI000F09545E|nr:CYTH and CHAD domain-containing protein [Acinetobacter sp. B51(2017)]